MRNQYKLLQEKYDIINDARISEALNPRLYGPCCFNFLEYTKNYPDQEEFIDWLYSELKKAGEIEDEDSFDEFRLNWAVICDLYCHRVEVAFDDDHFESGENIEAGEKAIAEAKNGIDKYYQKWKIMIDLKALAHLKSIQ